MLPFGMGSGGQWCVYEVDLVEGSIPSPPCCMPRRFFMRFSLSAARARPARPPLHDSPPPAMASADPEARAAVLAEELEVLQSIYVDELEGACAARRTPAAPRRCVTHAAARQSLVPTTSRCASASRRRRAHTAPRASVRSASRCAALFCLPHAD